MLIQNGWRFQLRYLEICRSWPIIAIFRPFWFDTMDLHPVNLFGNRIIQQNQFTNRSINLIQKEFSTFLFSFWQCEFKSGEGFRGGAYICKCAKGYFFPDIEAKEKYFKGYDIEQHVAINNTMSLFKYTCTRCAPGCEECTDRSPCLFTRNVYIKVLVLVLTSFVIILIFIASGIIFRLKESKVRSYTILWQSFQGRDKHFFAPLPVVKS